MSDLRGDALRELVARQCGMVTGRQFAKAGVDRNAVHARVVSGRWQRMYRGVYATYSGQPDRLATLWAAVLYAGPGAMLSYETAAELTRLTDKPSKLVHVTIPAERRVTPAAGIVIHHSYRAAEARDPRRSPPQTNIDETVLDLVAAAATIDDACSWILRALQRRLTAGAYLAYGLTQRDRIPWRAELTELLTPDINGLHSILELRYHRDVEKRHHLPAGTRQHQARNGHRTIYRDILYAAYATAVELDGDAFHLADTRWRDIQRDNAAAADGITTLRYGWLDITLHPCQVAAEVARVLARHGYTAARPCSPDCPVGRR
jgi:Transcriptional regulator, AbiEi antitoxin